MASVTISPPLGNASTSSNPTLPLGTVGVGSYVLAMVAQSVATAPGRLSDSGGNTYKLVAQDQNASGLGTAIYGSWITVGGALTLSFSTTAPSIFGAIVAQNVLNPGAGQKGGPAGAIGSGNGSPISTGVSAQSAGDMAIALIFALATTNFAQQNTGWVVQKALATPSPALSLELDSQSATGALYLPASWTVTPPASCVTACILLPHS